MSHHSRFSWRYLLSLIGMALVMLVSLANCGRTVAPRIQTLHSQPSTTYALSLTAAPTYTAAPAHPLQWQARSLPAPLADINPSISSSTNGTAWMCAPAGSGARVWVTHDSARHWQRVSDVIVSGRVDGCSVVTDEVDPAIAIVQTFQYQTGCCALPAIPYPLAGTRDGGQTWVRVNGPYQELSHLASYHGISYAVFHAPFADMVPGRFAFASSSDGLRTWKLMDSQLASQQTYPVDTRGVRDFWLNPATGELLVHSQTSVVWTNTFEASSNGGATWRNLHAPVADEFVVRAPFAAGPWEICGLRKSTGSFHPDWPAPLICTLDSGKTWTNRNGVGMYDNATFALANDGYALAASPAGIYRSAPHTSAWESLGKPPAAGAFWYEYQPGAGLIWALPQTSGTNTQPTSYVYVASYA